MGLLPLSIPPRPRKGVNKFTGQSRKPFWKSPPLWPGSALPGAAIQLPSVGGGLSAGTCSSEGPRPCWLSAESVGGRAGCPHQSFKKVPRRVLSLLEASAEGDTATHVSRGSWGSPTLRPIIKVLANRTPDSAFPSTPCLQSSPFFKGDEDLRLCYHLFKILLPCPLPTSNFRFPGPLPWNTRKTA